MRKRVSAQTRKRHGITDNVLITAARSARLNAYAPYSKFRVGASVLTADGHVFTGANVENASYGLSQCAERVAIHHAVATGHRDLRIVAVVADGEEATMPCGACRQVMAEFGIRKVIVATPHGGTRVRSLNQLLKEPFLPERLPRKSKGGRRA
ncbi:MAG TPA: cytidine deaminase [bacterium]|nr:cytidine deaminase [bacterium]